MYQEIYNNCRRILLEAGELIELEKKKDFKIIRKSKKELVTEIDLKVQKYITDNLKSISDFDIFHEEDKGFDEDINLENCFIIDPVDATHNMVAGLPFYNLSLGCVVQGKPIFGIIHFPYSKETYHAYEGQGAFRDKEKINVSNNNDLEKSIVAYDNQFHLAPNCLENYKRLIDNVFTTRILGSANRDACFVAEGSLDARVWNSTKVYDIVAGLVIVTEAGGCVSDFGSNEINLNNIKSVLMSNHGTHKDLLSLLN